MRPRLPTCPLKALCGLVLLLTPLAGAQPANTPHAGGAPSPPTPVPPQPQTIEPISWEALSRLLGGPSLLSVHLNEATPQQVVQALSEQSPLPFSLYGADWSRATKITADFEQQPFWLVVRQLEQQGGFLAGFDIWRPGVALRLVGPRPWIPLGQQGPFDFTFRSAELAPQDPGTGRDKAESQLRLVFRMLIDPKVRFLDGTFYLRLTEALDDQGHSLMPDTPEDNFSSSGHQTNQSMQFLDLSLKPHPAMSKRLKRVAGELRTLVVTRQETWEIGNPLQVTNQAKVMERGKSRDRFLLEQTRQQGDDYVVDLTLAHPQAEAPPFYRTADGREFFLGCEDFGPVRLLDVMGRDLANWVFDTDYLGGQAVTLATVKCVFHRDAHDPAPAGAPAKLLITVPTEWRELVVPFEFHDLALP